MNVRKWLWVYSFLCWGVHCGYAQNRYIQVSPEEFLELQKLFPNAMVLGTAPVYTSNSKVGIDSVTGMLAVADSMRDTKAAGISYKAKEKGEMGNTQSATSCTNGDSISMAICQDSLQRFEKMHSEMEKEQMLLRHAIDEENGEVVKNNVFVMYLKDIFGDKENKNSKGKFSFDDEWAVVFFVVVGAVVVSTMIVAGTSLVVQTLYTDEKIPHYFSWGGMGAYGRAWRSGNSGDILESNSFGFAYGNWTADRGAWGLGLETRLGIHHSSITDTWKQEPIFSTQRGLVLIGPTLTLGKEAPLRTTFSFLPGLTLTKTPEFIASADCRWDLLKLGKWNFGAYFGSILANLGATDGLIQKDLGINRDLNFVMGIQGSWGN